MAAGGPGLQTVIRGGAVSDCHTAPVAFGALGVPILVAGQVRESIRSTLAQWRDVSYRSCRSCAVLAGSNDGRLERGERDVPAALVAGGSFAVTQFFTSNLLVRNCRILLRRW